MLTHEVGLTELRPSVKSFWFQTHLVLGLFSGALVSVVALTGAICVFDRDLRQRFGEPIEAVGDRERLPPADLMASLERQGLAGDPLWFIWYDGELEPVWVRLQGPTGEVRELLVDPYTGAHLPRATALHEFFQAVLKVHRTLAAGEIGRWITGIASFMLVILAVSGLCIASLRTGSFWRSFRLDRRERLARRRSVRWRSWHRVMGLWLTPLIVLSAVTGPLWTFESYRAVLGWITFSSFRSAPAVALAGAGGAASLEALWQAALPFVPEDRAMRLVLSPDLALPVRFEMTPAEAPFENFRSRVLLDPRTADVLQIQPLSDFTRAERLQRWAYPLHIGSWGGDLTRWGALAACLAVPILFVSGTYLYISRRRRRQAPASAVPEPCIRES